MVFTGQNLLTLKLETGLNLNSSTFRRIVYVKPDGTVGAFIPEVANNTQLQYKFSTGDIDQKGNWIFQAYVEFDGEKAWGDETTQWFDEPQKKTF